MGRTHSGTGVEVFKHHYLSKEGYFVDGGVGTAAAIINQSRLAPVGTALVTFCVTQVEHL
jgi:hypothetical protein